MNDLSDPLENIVRDVAGTLLSEHLSLMVRYRLPGHSRALLVTRAAQVGAAGLVQQLLGDAPAGWCDNVMYELRRRVQLVHDELVTYCEQGPVPSREKYEAATAALEQANRSADDAARATILAYRDERHRENTQAKGYCICRDSWSDAGCDEYVSLTMYRSEPDYQAVSADKDPL